ncbi:MAG: hypothetical protein Q9165_001038 [Trypethelium subeluteriae]
MNFLASNYDIKEFKRDLTILSTTPDEVYRTALERIKMQDERSHNLAIKVITWLTFSERDLKTDELAHAIAISNSVDSIRARQASLPTRSETSRIDALTSPCVGLVVVDKESHTVRLAHSTAEEYLRREESIFQHAQSKLTETCLICLTSMPLTLSNSTTLPTDELDKYCERYPFLRYATDHWGDHLSNGKQGRDYKLAWEFLSNKRKLNAMIHFMDRFRLHHEKDVSGLHLAVYFGLTKLIKKAMKHTQHIAIDAKTLQGRTPLHWAVRYGQEGLLQFLVGKGADPDIFDEHGKTALHMAISDGDTASVKVLLSSPKSIDLQHEDVEGWTPLRLAAKNGRLKMVKILLQGGAEVDAHDRDGWTALRWAASKGHKMIAQLLLDKGASPSSPSIDNGGLPDAAGNHSWTMLGWAAQKGQEDFVRLLAKKRVDLNVTDGDGCTPLRQAVKYGRTMTAWLLIQAHADVNKPDKKGFTVLHEAVSSNKDSILFLLLENGANVNAKTKLGVTPLHMAAAQGNISVLWLLLQKKADWDQRDSNRRTALHWATAEGQVNAIHFLTWRDHSIIPAKDDEKRTALHVAASQGNTLVVDVLLNSEADIDSQDMQGQTPLHVAVYQEHEEVVACLIRSGANVKIRDRKKRTAADLAASSRKESVIQAFHQTDDRNRALDPSARVWKSSPSRP